MSERIVAAAIQICGITHSMPPPARHHTILHAMPDVVDWFVGPDDQGFLTSTGRFVSRTEGKEIAAAAGQLLDSASAHPHLFSEDMW